MNKKTVRDIDVKGKRVLVRVDFNVPIKDGKVQDDTRIRASLPTIKYILDNGGAVIAMSHLGRPDGRPVPEFSLAPVSEKLAELLGRKVLFAKDCIGEDALKMAKTLKPGEVLLLENLRFYPEEEGKPVLPPNASEEEKQSAKRALKKKQVEFAKKLAALGDVYVNDAFGTAHRAHASIAVVTNFMKEKVAGFLMEKEIKYLSQALSNPDRPFVAILGGAKISDKINVITNLLNKVDSIIIGGGMAYTFYRAKGLPIGDSIVEEDKVELAKDILKKAEEKKVKFLLPVDHVVARELSATAQTKVVGEKEIEPGWKALDIGPKSIKLFADEISRAKTVVWNGPMGCFEFEPFANGTMSIIKAIANTKCVSIIGGGDSVSAINKSGLADKITHISTGGGASLEFLEGKELPGVVVLDNK
jgi:phosphoglycerate kinase